jgi:hypothetical protein
MRLISEPDITVDYDNSGLFHQPCENGQQSRQLATIKPTGLIGRRLFDHFRHFKIGAIIRPVANEKTSRNSVGSSVMNIGAGDHFFSE